MKWEIAKILQRVMGKRAYNCRFLAASVVSALSSLFVPFKKGYKREEVDKIQLADMAKVVAYSIFESSAFWRRKALGWFGGNEQSDGSSHNG